MGTRKTRTHPVTDYHSEVSFSHASIYNRYTVAAIPQRSESERGKERESYDLLLIPQIVTADSRLTLCSHL